MDCTEQVACRCSGNNAVCLLARVKACIFRIAYERQHLLQGTFCAGQVCVYRTSD